MTYQCFWDAANAILWGKSIDLNVYTQKRRKAEKEWFNAQKKRKEKKNQRRSNLGKVEAKKKIIKTRAEIEEIEIYTVKTYQLNKSCYFANTPFA